jgi:hypothetical protein
MKRNDVFVKMTHCAMITNAQCEIYHTTAFATPYLGQG